MKKLHFGIALVLLSSGAAIGAASVILDQKSRSFRSLDFSIALNLDEGCASQQFQEGVQASLAQPAERLEAVFQIVRNGRHNHRNSLRDFHRDKQRAKVLSQKLSAIEVGGLFCQSASFENEEFRLRGLESIASTVFRKPVGALSKDDGRTIGCALTTPTGNGYLALKNMMESGDVDQLNELCGPSNED